MSGIRNENIYGDRIGIGLGQTTPTALAQFAAGTATAGTAPQKFAAGTNLTSPEVGAYEFDGTNLFITNTVPTRITLLGVATAGSTGQLLTGVTSGYPVFANSSNGDFTFTSSTAASSRTFTVTNTDNTNAASHAIARLITGGASGGNPFVLFSTTATNYAVGINNAASDQWELCASSSVLGAGTALIIESNGLTTITNMLNIGNQVPAVQYELTVERSNSGGGVEMVVTNLSDTASSTAFVGIVVGGANAGDPTTIYNVAAVSNFISGMDNSVTGDPYKIAAGSSLGTNDVFISTSAGEITMPLQPTVIAYKGSDTNNATGDGTAVTIIGDTEVTDANSDYNNSTGVYTSPVTGTHYGTCTVTNSGVGVATSVLLDFVTSNRTYRSIPALAYGVVAGGDTASVHAHYTADMDAADTASWVETINGTTKTISIRGTASPHITVVEFGLLN